MTTKHTPGPWTVERTTIGTYVMAGNFCVSMTADSRTGNVSPSMENARLIAAAPDLLAALREIYDFRTTILNAVQTTHFSGRQNKVEAALEMVRAAIAKVEG